MSDTLSSDLTATFAELEPLAHRADSFGWSREQLAEVVAEDFVEFASTGVSYSRDEVLDTMTRWQQERHDYGAIAGLRADLIAPGICRVTYTLTMGSRVTLRFTLWRFENDRWRAVFHQGTLVSA